MKINLPRESNRTQGQAPLQGQLSDLPSWVKSFAPREWKPSDLRMLSNNLSRATMTHSGLIYYLHACWAKELGCVLRPDMIYFTILSELASCVLKRPQDFKSLFTAANGKTDLVIMDLNALNGGLNIQTLCNALKKHVVSKELYQLVCDTQFASDDPCAREARCMAFCEMGIPFYNYLSTFCGISSVEVQGQLSEWEKLYQSVVRLGTLLSPRDSIGELKSLISRSLMTISALIYFTFGKQYVVDPKYPNVAAFFGDIFHYGSNHQCGSGHDEYIVGGWIRNFYLSKGEDITNFSSSMSYVPYLNIETQRKFVQVCTLAYSEIVNGVAIPHYGKIMFEVLNEDLFNQIAMKNGKQHDMFMWE